MSKKLSVEMLNVHPTMTTALRKVKMHPTLFQVRVLSNIKTDFADIVVDGRAACGGNQNTANSNNTSNSSYAGGDGGALNTRAAVTERYTLINVFLGHCLLYAEDQLRCTAVLLANTKDSAAQLKKNMKSFADLCDIDCHVLTQEGDPPSSLLLSPSAEAAAIRSEAQSSAFTGRTRHLIITTLDVLRSWDKELLRAITTFAVEDVGFHREQRRLEEILRGITTPAPQLPPVMGFTSASHPRGGGHGEGNSSVPSQHPHNTTRRTANIFLMYLAPLTKLSPRIRYCLNHRNRRYYHLQGSSPPAGVVLQTPSGTAPPSSTQLVHLLYLDEKDREEQLRRVLQIYHSRRVVILTHHKEIKHLYETISKWGLYNNSSDSHDGGGGGGGGGGKRSNSVCCMLRTDSRERRDASMMGFLGESSTNNSSSTANNSNNNNNDSSNNSNSNNNNRGSSALLVTWDATTEVDLMDVDLLIQYYPPQKSLTERERREYVQVLHTTADPEISRRGRRTMLITFISTNDFTLTSFFMEQYGQSGPILNLAPQHPQFERCLNNPNKVLKLKQEKEDERRKREGVATGSSNSAAAGQQQQQSQSQSHQHNQQQQQPSQNTNSGGGSSGGAGAGAALPVPRSKLNVPSAAEKKKDQTRSRSNKKGGDKNHHHHSSRGRSGGGGGDNNNNNNNNRPHEEKKSVETTTTTSSRRTAGGDGHHNNNNRNGVKTTSSTPTPQTTNTNSTNNTNNNTRAGGGGEGSRGARHSR